MTISNLSNYGSKMRRTAKKKSTSKEVLFFLETKFALRQVKFTLWVKLLSQWSLLSKCFANLISLYAEGVKLHCVLAQLHIGKADTSLYMPAPDCNYRLYVL